ncbi:hypothetical protein Noca_4736 (plasmid) [Nocardioides sp. JS614]|nr:hypothetical protein Noca_4736 [Nocardioides sp. JS614]
MTGSGQCPENDEGPVAPGPSQMLHRVAPRFREVMRTTRGGFVLPTVEHVHGVRESFPRPRVDTHSAHAAASPARLCASRSVADLVVELHAVTRPTSSLSQLTWREVGAAGGSRSGRGSP